jgi:membrane protein DedA with SNARE-associated domain
MPAIAIAVGAAVATVVIAYWFGRRRGRKRQTVLEIRRM